MCCPACDRLVVVCDEDAAVFLDAKNLETVAAGDVDSLPCPECGQHKIGDFVLASDVTIRSRGLSVDEYE